MVNSSIPRILWEVKIQKTQTVTTAITLLTIRPKESIKIRLYDTHLSIIHNGQKREHPKYPTIGDPLNQIVVHLSYGVQ